MVSVNIDFKKKDFFWAVPFVLILVIGFGVSAYSSPIPENGHGGDNIWVSYSGVEQTLQSALSAVAAGGVAAESINDVEIIDNSLTALSLAANSVGDSELIANPTVSTPTASAHIANKQYVDAKVDAAGGGGGTYVIWSGLANAPNCAGGDTSLYHGYTSVLYGVSMQTMVGPFCASGTMNENDGGTAWSTYFGQGAWETTSKTRCRLCKIN